MRRFIFILMIALLPLRGWMGEAMATEMAAINLIAAQATKTPDTINLPFENSMPDCDMHQSKTQDESGSNQRCTDCQACHLVGALNTVQKHRFLGIVHAEPIAFLTRYVSAEPNLAQKPPIL
jgi:hypothetical protein